MATSLKNLPGDGFQVEPHGNGFAESRNGSANRTGDGNGAALASDPALSRRLAESAATEHFWGWNEFLRLGRRHTEKFMSLLQIVLEDKDPAAVHKLRASCRRLEQILALIYAKPVPGYARRLRRRVKRCRHLLGTLGDYDVPAKIAARSLNSDPSRDAAAWQAVNAFIQQRRATIAARVLQELAQMDFASPCAKFQRDLEENGALRRVYCDGKFQKLAPEKADKIVQQRLLHSLAHLWRDFESLVEESRDDPCAEVIHRVRIATKRLRHLVEVMKKLGVTGSADTLTRLHGLQWTIGEWHDLEVLEHLTGGLLTRKKFVREHLELAVEIKQLFLRNRALKKSAEEKCRRMAVNSRDYQEIRNWVAARLPGRAPARLPLNAPPAAPPPPDSAMAAVA